MACLCEGDPFFYGSFSFLFARMVERYPVRVIPGVSSLTACAAAAGAVSDETPGMTRTGYRSTMRANRKLNDP